MKHRTRFCGFISLLIFITASCRVFEPANPAPDTGTPAGSWPTDSWQLASPEENGLNGELFQQMFAEIEAEGLAVDSVVVVYRGEIISEKYYPPYTQDSFHDTWSVTKSIMSALIGIAIAEGSIKSVDTPVLDFFPDRTFQNEDPLKRAITLEHLLTMTSGLPEDLDAMVRSRDWVQYVLDQPVNTEPGKEFFYNSGNTHLLSAVIQEASGMSTRDFARQHLFGPLGITDLRWDTDPQGIYTGGWGIQMKPRDLAKIGLLYLHQGRWDGLQVVPAEWVKTSIEPHVRVPDPIEPWELSIGFSWWVHEAGMFAAHGARGQFIYVIPSSDLVVVFNSNLAEAEFARPQMLIRDYILPAVPQATP